MCGTWRSLATGCKGIRWQGERLVDDGDSGEVLASPNSFPPCLSQLISTWAVSACWTFGRLAIIDASCHFVAIVSALRLLVSFRLSVTVAACLLLDYPLST